MGLNPVLTILIARSLWMFYIGFDVQKYCVKMAYWLLSFGAPLKFCARSECLAHLTLGARTTQVKPSPLSLHPHPLRARTRKQQVAPARTWHSSLSFPTCACLPHRILAWTKRKGNKPGVFPESKTRKVLILLWTAVFGLDLLLDSS